MTERPSIEAAGDPTIPRGVAAARATRILVLSSSLLTDRMFLYTGCLHRLARESSITIWSTTYGVPELSPIWRRVPGEVKTFPPVRPFKHFPYTYLRRLNEFAWDYRLRIPSRMSMMRLRDRRQSPITRSLKLPGWAIARLGLEERFERMLDGMLTRQTRSPEAKKMLREDPPDFVVATAPFQFEQPALVAAARKAGIPVLALIPSWDNLSTKSRMVFDHDGYLVWSPRMREELDRFYPASRKRPVYVIGAPQFDVFFREEFRLSREEFCRSEGLRPDRPIVVYALGSPLFIGEHHGALDFAQRVVAGDLGDVQLLVRPHPIHASSNLRDRFDGFGARVRVQQPGLGGKIATYRSQDETEIGEWVNTFRHADVVVNLSSTVAIDAAIFDRPVVNLDYDPEPGRPNQAIVKEINHVWSHFKPIAESGGVWLVDSPEETVEAVRTYLARPELHRERRAWMVEYVCGHADGRCGERMAEAILDFAGRGGSSEP